MIRLWSGWWTATALFPLVGGLVLLLVGLSETNAALQALWRAGWTPERCWTVPVCAEHIGRAARWYLIPAGLAFMLAAGLAMRPVVLHVAPLRVNEPLQERPRR